MNELIKIIEFYCDKYFSDEDGNRVGVELNRGITSDKIVKFESSNNIEVPSDLRKLLLLSNGLNLFGLQILSLEEMEFFPNSGILSFHKWGNGDFDCISIGDYYPKGSIVFMSHSEDRAVLVHRTLKGWFKSVITEIEKTGALLHPLDYTGREVEGMYKNIFEKLN